MKKNNAGLSGDSSHVIFLLCSSDSTIVKMGMMLYSFAKHLELGMTSTWIKASYYFYHHHYYYSGPQTAISTMSVLNK